MDYKNFRDEIDSPVSQLNYLDNNSVSIGSMVISD